MGITETIGQFFRATAETMGFVNKRTDLKNAPDVRAAAEGQKQTDEKDRIQKDVASGDIDAVRRDLAD